MIFSLYVNNNPSNQQTQRNQTIDVHAFSFVLQWEMTQGKTTEHMKKGRFKKAWAVMTPAEINPVTSGSVPTDGL